MEAESMILPVEDCQETEWYDDTDYAGNSPEDYLETNEDLAGLRQ